MHCAKVLCGCTLLLALFNGVTSVRAETLHYQGTHILTYETMTALAEAFRARTGVEVVVKGGGCADGIAVVEGGRFEMGGLCCPPRENETKDLGITAHAVARDIKTVVVNAANPLENLATEELRALHQGRIGSWRVLGWEDRPAAVIYRVHCLDREEPVRTYLGLDERLGNLAPKAIKVRTDKELIDYVSRFPTAVGVTSGVFVKNGNVKALRLDGVPPTAAAVEEGRYPFTATLYIVTGGEPEEDVRRFLDFVRSDEGQQIVRRNLAGIP